jgi:hypothetical protein
MKEGRKEGLKDEESNTRVGLFFFFSSLFHLQLFTGFFVFIFFSLALFSCLHACLPFLPSSSAVLSTRSRLPRILAVSTYKDEQEKGDLILMPK